MLLGRDHTYSALDGLRGVAAISLRPLDLNSRVLPLNIPAGSLSLKIGVNAIYTFASALFYASLNLGQQLAHLSGRTGQHIRVILRAAAFAQPKSRPALKRRGLRPGAGLPAAHFLEGARHR
jgi:hypothetical protein